MLYIRTIFSRNKRKDYIDMLNTQIFLRQFGDWELALKSLSEQYSISSTISETDGRVILNYSQIESPKYNDIVQECRGLVLDRYDNWNLVARSFKRFFNWEEYKSATELFNWENCITQTKEDGSLAILYYYAGQWHFNTRGSFGNGIVNDSHLTWRQLFDMACANVGFDSNDLLPEYTYIFELCSRYNQVVRDYPTPIVYLLSIFKDEEELDWEIAKSIGEKLNPTTQHTFTNIEDINTFLIDNSEADPTFEGIVLRDKTNLRFKVKSLKYIDLHRLNNNGNLASPKSLIGFIMDGEIEEIIAYFPSISDRARDMENKINEAYIHLESVWMKSKDIENQREFAEYVLTETKFSGILFTARKTGKPVNETWRESKEVLLKVLFKE